MMFANMHGITAPKNYGLQDYLQKGGLHWRISEASTVGQGKSRVLAGFLMLVENTISSGEKNAALVYQNRDPFCDGNGNHIFTNIQNLLNC